MNWKFWQTDPALETRSDSLTDALVQLLVNNATGASLANVNESGALEIASGLIGRCFQAAKVKTARASIIDAVPSSLLGMVGRGLVRRGEVLFYIKMQGGVIRLFPCSSWDVEGGYNPESWHYNVTLSGPGESVTLSAPAARILHFKYSVDPERPWEGVAPMKSAALAGRLNSEANLLLADESSGPRGSILPLGKDPDTTVDSIVSKLKSLAGGVAMVESMSQWGVTKDLPKAEWETKRIGPTTPESLNELRRQSDLLVLGACGIPTALFDKSDGTGLREAYRLLLVGTLIPTGRGVALELGEKLDAPGLVIDWSEARAADIQGRARSFQSLTSSGMDAERAANLSGLT